MVKLDKRKILKITNEEFIEEVYSLVGDEYTFLEDYKGSSVRITIKHNTCGHEYKVSPSNFKGSNSKKGTRCPKCQKTHKRTPEEFVDDIFKLVNNEYQVLSDFKKAIIKVEFKHTVCGHEFKMRPNDFLNGSRCPKCYGIHRRTTDEFKQEVVEIHGEDYVVLGEFVRTAVKIRMKHVICGYEYEATPNSILAGHGCNKCKHSQGEKMIAKYLKVNNIKNFPEYRFDECRYINPLPFDFAVIDSDGKITLLIEYDGEGHFKPFRYSKDVNKNIQKFKDTQRNDQIKNKYCEDNNIPLLRIPYWEFESIENILSNHPIISDSINK